MAPIGSGTTNTTNFMALLNSIAEPAMQRQEARAERSFEFAMNQWQAAMNEQQAQHQQRLQIALAEMERANNRYDAEREAVIKLGRIADKADTFGGVTPGFSQVMETEVGKASQRLGTIAESRQRNMELISQLQQQAQQLNQASTAMSRIRADYNEGVQDSATARKVLEAGKRLKGNVGLTEQYTINADELRVLMGTIDEATKAKMGNEAYMKGLQANIEALGQQDIQTTLEERKVGAMEAQAQADLIKAGGGATGQDPDLFVKLQSQADKFTKEYQVIRDNMSNIEIASEELLAAPDDQGRIAIDEAIITSYKKILDPNSVVRESEFFRTEEGQSLLGQARGAIEKLNRSGTKLSVADLLSIRDIARRMAEARRLSTNERLEKQIRVPAIRFGYNPDEIAPLFASQTLDTDNIITEEKPVKTVTPPPSAVEVGPDTPADVIAQRRNYLKKALNNTGMSGSF